MGTNRERGPGSRQVSEGVLALPGKQQQDEGEKSKQQFHRQAIHKRPVSLFLKDKHIYIYRKRQHK